MLIFTPTTTSDSDLDSRKMKLVYFSNEFPRDDLQNFNDKHHSHLAQFICEATWAIKEEARNLPTELKKLIPPFKTLVSWSENTEIREGLICGAVDGVLLVVVQIATYIGYAENSPEELTDFPNLNLAGLGIGLLASTAVSLSSTLADLPLAGADAVRLAFRLGIHVLDVSENLEARDLSESPDTWAYVVHNIDPDIVRKELDTLYLRDEIPGTGKIFVSAVSRTSVTVSGPPARLKALFNKSDFFRESTFIALPVYGGLCHAPHIYDMHDTQSIVDQNSLLTVRTKSWPGAPIYSTSTSVTYPAKKDTELFESVISEILTQAIYWDRVISGVVERVKTTVTSEVALYSFGNSIPLNDLNSALKSSITHSNVSISNLTTFVTQVAPKDTTPRSTSQSKLAIVGMSCRLPGGATNTEKGLDVSRKIPADRFDIETHYDPAEKELNKTMTQYGCFIGEPGLFDAPFFNISPRESQVTDSQMRLVLITAYEALERAGYIGNCTASTQLQRIGTFYGQAADDYREINQGQEVSTYYIPGGCGVLGPGRINYFFKFAGPSYSIDTACSSGLAAIEVTCQALWNGEVDTAVTGGVNVLTNPDGFSGLCNGHFLTKGYNACKTWDTTTDGYCRADGIGSLAIKRLEDAEADNDNILGVILGAGTNHSAEAVSITHPHAGHQAYLSRQVLRQAGVDPLDVSYIEIHGTGIQAGDHEEMQGIMDVYAPLTRRRSKDQPLKYWRRKSKSLIKVLLMLQKNAVPPHIGIKTEINPKFEIDPRKTHIIAISAKVKTSLTGNIDRLIGYLDSHPNTNSADLSYTTTARRYHHTHRVAIATSDVAHLKRQLSSSLDKVDLINPVGMSGPPLVAFSFTGQGASYKSMSLELYRGVPTFRKHIQYLESLGQGQGFPSFIAALDASYPNEHAHSAVITQLALVCTEIALAKHWATLGVKPDVVLGHSLGEYAAIHTAGVITASDAIFMVGRRAQMLEEKCKVGSYIMMAVRASVAEIVES
ncbi:polyketide synthase, putative [Talaromyces stipitatus ATCC 10500]|uniref:Polyketide synthase, putative n=1 Tax=Talaromyces stipitatus (strain ATCC 10500 / CBS 375.48 / QM 6759 / NRRL 1006) TaxID=441959 RepID=B8MLT4_TALSN|nr:polyketide synthase, putative [Talaromyces stipitatus ATCC 10500]EED13801.1 polyketide synthase, putative [Talaromyces stipitatus ATCC 10500]